MGSSVCFKFLYLTGMWIPIEKSFSKMQKFVYYFYTFLIFFSLVLTIILQIIFLIKCNNIPEFNEVLFNASFLFIAINKMLLIVISKTKIIDLCDAFSGPLIKSCTTEEFNLKKDCDNKSRLFQ